MLCYMRLAIRVYANFEKFVSSSAIKRLQCGAESHARVSDLDRCVGCHTDGAAAAAAAAGLKLRLISVQITSGE